MKSVKTGQFRSFPVIRNTRLSRLLYALSRIKASSVKQQLRCRSIHSSFLSAAKNKDLEPLAMRIEDSEEYVCHVRTGISKQCFAFELIGTLRGKEAEKAARWTVHQEYYRTRSKLQRSLLEELRSEHPDFPIKTEKVDEIEELVKKKAANPVAVVLTSLEEWLSICVYSLGVNETRRVIALAIETAYNQAKELIYDSESQVSKQTKSICIDELLSKINVIQKKRESISDQKNETHNSIAEANGVQLDEVINISLPLRERIHRCCLQASIDAATNHAKSKFEHLLPKLDSVAKAGAIIYPTGSANYTDRVRYSLRCHGPGVQKLRSQIQDGVQITQFLDGIHDPFENIPEYQIFKDAVRIIERILTVPKAKHIWVGIRDPEYKTDETASFERKEDLKFYGFRSNVVQAMEKQDSEWDCLELSEQQLVAFLLGMSEYLCDDFGLKSRPDSKSMIFYPTDTPLKLGWLPHETVLYCEGIKGHHQLPLSPQMVQELKEVCEFLLDSVSDLVLLSPPLPRYILERAEVKNRKNRTLQTLFFTSLVILLSLWYGLSRRVELTERLNKAQVYISEIINRKK